MKGPMRIDMGQISGKVDFQVGFGMPFGGFYSSAVSMSMRGMGMCVCTEERRTRSAGTIQ